jgi:predicted AAA+ superfamily ATPase
MSDRKSLVAYLERLAAALERLAPPASPKFEFGQAEAFVWQTSPEAFLPVARVNRQPLALLKGIDRAPNSCSTIPAVLPPACPPTTPCCGARAAWANPPSSRRRRRRCGAPGSWPRQRQADLKLIEIHREDIAALPQCLAHLRTAAHRFIVFCDDLSFDKDDTSYKS